MSKTVDQIHPSLLFPVNRLMVSSGCSLAENDQRQVEDCVAAKLNCHPQLQGNSKRVKCRVLDRRLYLSGNLPSWYLKQMAQEAVRDVEGIDEIVNDVLVTDSAAE